jgi:hypothetical protein
MAFSKPAAVGRAYCLCFPQWDFAVITKGRSGGAGFSQTRLRSTPLGLNYYPYFLTIQKEFSNCLLLRIKLYQYSGTVNT